MTYHQLMQAHINATPARPVLQDLTPAQLLEMARRPLPVFVKGVRTDGPVGALERLAIARGKKS